MSKIIAAYGGGFKPPQKGHFEVVQKALNDSPEIEEFIIYVGGVERGGINQAQSILIWEIYQTYLPMKVKIEPSKSPIGDVIRLGKKNPQDEVYFVIGAREGFEDDIKDIESRTKNIEEKYPNMKIKVITTTDSGVSGTNARQAAKVSYDDFIKFIPSELSENEKEEVYNIVKPSIKETDNPEDGKSSPFGSGYKKLNENASYGKDIDVKGKIMQLTQHMLDKGMNIEPLPKVEFVDGDSDNARDFFGKTAYYNPENQTITLFTEGRHPKDIVRSFAHEMIHHIQNLEDRLGDVSTTNTMEDDNIDKLEQEANLKGTMTFRNWTDSLNEDLSNISLDYIKTKLPKLDSYPKSDIILSKGDFVYLEIPQDANNPYSMVYEIKVFDIKDGTLVAQSSFDYDDNNKLKGTLDVRPDKRRMGIATEIYKLAEKIIGDTIFPEEKHTEDAEKFWRQKNRSFGPQNYDSLNEVKYTNPNFELEWEEAVRYPEFKEMGKENWIKIAKQGKLVNYSSIKDILGNVDLNFDSLEEPKKQRFQSAFKKGTIETPIAVKFSDNDYDLVAGNTRLSGLVKNGEDPKIWIVNIGSINEYDNVGPSTPKVYIVKDDGTYKEAPIELLSKISNLTYDMGGGETNFYPAKNIVIVDNIPVEEFAKEPGDIKGEKVYVEYNLNNPTSLPKANKIIASQLVYHLDNREAFAQTVANSLKDGGTFEFQSDLMNKKDKMFLQHLSDEYGFGLPTKLNQYKQESLPLKKGEFVEPVISYTYKITDKDGKTATLSVTKKGKWWEYEKIDGDLDFKTGKFSTPPIDPDPDFRDKKYTLRTFDKYLSFFGDSNTIVDFEELNEANKPYKHKHGFNDKLGKDPFGLNQYARELAQGLKEAIVGDKIECDNCDWSWDIKDGGDDLYTCHKCWHDNTPKQLNEGRYDTLTNKLSSIAFEVFKDIHDRGDKEGSFKFRVDHPDDEHDIPSKDFYFDFEGKVEITDDEYGVDGGANSGFDNEGEEITPLLSVKFKIPKNPDWQKVSFDIKDVVRHELEHLTQDGENERSGKYMEDDQLLRDLIDADMLPKSQYFKLEKEVDAMLQGLYFKAKKAKRPFGDVINDYLNIFIDQETITQEEKEEVLNIWRSRGKSLSLPLFEQMEDMDYEIYSDMDGVLTDFDAQFMKASDGILPSEYEKTFGKDGFWELIDGKGVGFWVGMPWMSDGKQYWDYIKKYTPILLSSPSRSQTSRLGKRLWVRNNMPGTKLILAQAKDKQNYAQKNRILIDDRPSNIDQWRASGGIGILHTSASDTIRQLKELGL